ncbi:MAG: ribosome assembly RNA-binding protein YhbY [Gammaproteobacteria bacterium]|nr:ribosome assembly RNA-binding protein YhbY [Gammaproteobacteria bacterium]
MNLTNKQIKFLKSKAHDYKPVVIIGSNGLTDGVINETNIVLDTHELVKVKVNADDKVARMAMIDTLIDATESNFIQLIGKIAILYRQRPNDATIELPNK